MSLLRWGAACLFSTISQISTCSIPSYSYAVFSFTPPQSSSPEACRRGHYAKYFLRKHFMCADFWENSVKLILTANNNCLPPHLPTAWKILLSCIFFMLLLFLGKKLKSPVFNWLLLRSLLVTKYPLYFLRTWRHKSSLETLLWSI